MEANKKDIEKYLTKYSETEDSVLQELNRETNLKVLRPRMISGNIQGKFLEMITKMINPKKILELGTFTGYSAICFAKGLSENGKLHTIEINDELEDFILKYFEKAKVLNKITLHIGNAIDILPNLDNDFELVFIDADKRQYIEYYNLVIDKVKPGGFILADNVLWNGKVIEMGKPDDEYTKGIMEFNKYIKNDKRVENVILPLRDGLTLIRKKIK
ncbi:MAG: O-methyltransferase [Bacteroidota bacterium]|nr:O-methyltransferase [Bacteroidota bacterium]